jgi:hypothetical protein
VKFCSRQCVINQLICCRMIKQQNIIKIGCRSNSYTAFQDSHSFTISRNFSLNPCNFKCCHAARFQLYAPCMFVKILQNTDISVPPSNRSYARTCGIYARATVTMNYLRRSHKKGRSRSTHFPGNVSSSSGVSR